MSNVTKPFTHTFALLATSFAAMISLGAQTPTPAIKPGLWEMRMSQLDANGKEMPSPELAALARMPPERRAQMEEAMRARGMQLPDETGAIKACVTRDNLETGLFQQLNSEMGCTTNYSTRTASLWKWHSSCPSLKSESDGEVTFVNNENYHTKVVSTNSMSGTPRTTTRIATGKWLSATCGNVKPMDATPATGRGR